MEIGVHVKLKIHESIPVISDNPESLVAKVERIIIADIK
jgi:1-acyl-sn-glycerol-3-phosphate acyltransferase